MQDGILETKLQLYDTMKNAEALLGRDPLAQIAQALRRAATSPDEKALAREGIKKLKEFRDNWRKYVLNQREEFPDRDLKEIVGRARNQNNAPGLIDTRNYSSNSLLHDFPSVEILSPLVNDERKIYNIPSDAFTTRVLRQLGALMPDKNMSDLIFFPSSSYHINEPLYSVSSKFAYRVRAQNVTSGYVDLKIFLGIDDPFKNRIIASMDIPTFEKALNLKNV